MAWKRRSYPVDRGMPGTGRVVPLSVRLTVADKRLLEKIVEECDYGRSEALRRGLHCLAEDIWGMERYAEVMRDVRRWAEARG